MGSSLRVVLQTNKTMADSKRIVRFMGGNSKISGEDIVSAARREYFRGALSMMLRVVKVNYRCVVGVLPEHKSQIVKM